MQQTIIRKLNRAKWDNILITLTWLGLSAISVFGIYGTLEQAAEPGKTEKMFMSRRPPRARRRGEYTSDSASNGLSMNTPTTAY